MEAPEEETRDLLALHNKDEDSILAALYRMEQDAGGQKNTAQAGSRASIASYRRAVDDIVYSDDQKPFAHRNVLFGPTPQNLIDLGFEQLPMMITSKHIYTMAKEDGRFKGKDDHYHNLGAEMVRQLPDAIQKPIVTYVQSQNQRRITMITQLTDKFEKPVVVAVEFSGQTNYNQVLIYSNFVTTGYGQRESRILGDIKEAFAEQRILQADRKRFYNKCWGQAKSLTP